MTRPRRVPRSPEYKPPARPHFLDKMADPSPTVSERHTHDFRGTPAACTYPGCYARPTVSEPRVSTTGTCVEHQSPAEFFDDGSSQCLYCCVVEQSCRCTRAEAAQRGDSPTVSEPRTARKRMSQNIAALKSDRDRDHYLKHRFQWDALAVEAEALEAEAAQPIDPGSPTVSEPRTRTGRLLLNDSWRHENDPDNWRDSLLLRILAIEAEAAQPIDVKRLAALAYADRPPTGARPVPWPPRLRKDWEAWAQRIAARLRASDTDHD